MLKQSHGSVKHTLTNRICIWPIGSHWSIEWSPVMLDACLPACYVVEGHLEYILSGVDLLKWNGNYVLFVFCSAICSCIASHVVIAILITSVSFSYCAALIVCISVCLFNNLFACLFILFFWQSWSVGTRRTPPRGGAQDSGGSVGDEDELCICRRMALCLH